LSRVAATSGRTEAQVALNWCISHESVIAIPKSNSEARIEENCNASGWTLGPEERELLDGAFG
jgi:diketogulonate reductase-like aldo/keto reductase